MAKLFLEAIVAPGFDEAAREIFATKKNLRLLEVVPMEQKWVLKNVSGGVLLQDNDLRPLTEADLKVVSERQPTEQEMRRPAVRVEDVQARKVERDPLRA